jgi:tetratricopeptide (TPR) repeat protein
MLHKLPIIFALVVSLGWLAGCNVLEGFYEEGTSDDPEVLLQDAQLALRNGNYDKAIQYLELALEQNPENRALLNTIRTTLAQALLSANDISVVTLQRLASDLTDQLDGLSISTAAQQAAKATLQQADACSFGDTNDRADRVVELDTPTFRRIRDKADVLDRVIALLSDVFQLTESSVSGIAARIEVLRGQGFTDPQLQSQLFTLSVAYVVRAYIDVAEAGLNEVTWYRVIPAGGGEAYLGYCAPSDAVIEAIQAATACAMEELQTAVHLLQARVLVFGLEDTPADDVADLAEEAYDGLSVELGGVACTS